jgi:type I restriction enzyme, S subunit
MSERHGWNVRTIKDNAYLRGRIGWQGLRADEFCLEGPYLVTGTDFDCGRVNWTNCYHVSEARFREAAPIQLRDGDLLVTKDGTIGKVAYVRDCPDQAVLNSGVFLLRCADGSFQHRFLYHVLTSHHFDEFLRRNLAGSTINHLYQYVFERFTFMVPDGAQQERICRILDLIDTKIEATELLIAKQERVRAGLMQDLFTRGVDEHGRLRPSREEASHLYYQTELGWLPKGWEVDILQKLAAVDITYGIVQAGPDIPGGVPYIRTGDMSGEALDPGSLLRTSPEIAASFQRSRVQSGEIVIAIRATIGKALLVPRELDGANLTQGTARFAANTRLDRQFALRMLRSRQVALQVGIHTKGTTFSEITLADLRTVMAPYPSCMTEQRTIAAILAASDGRLNQLRGELGKRRLQKSGLMQDLLTGKVSVEPVLEDVAA